MSTCDFCQIVRGEQTARIVCATDSTLAFFPLEPAALGHTLVIPTTHVPDFLSIDSTLAGELARSVTHVGRALMRALKPEGMNAITSAGEAATQTVFHLHIHLVPRWQDDRMGDIWPPSTPWLEEIGDEVAELVRQECSSDGL